MSTEEDTELRDLVAQTLETNGCLSKIRAQLRASVFLALDEHEDLQTSKPLQNKKIETQLQSVEGRTMFCLVREFLEFFDLDFTISVYEPESYLGSAYQYEGRCKIKEDLGFLEIEDDSQVPLLLQIVKMAQTNNKVGKNDAQSSETSCRIGNNDLYKHKEKESIKTDEYSSQNNTNVSEKLKESSKSSVIKDHPKHVMEVKTVSKNNFNETFNVSNGEVEFEAEQSASSHPINLDPQDDTYEDTSSITEDTVSKNKEINLIDLDKSFKSTSTVTNRSEAEKSNSILDQSLIETERSPPIVKESKPSLKFDSSLDKLKLSPQKTDKLKPKSSLSSLADLPPLQLNKSRETMVLPSLYSKEFKEKKTEMDKFLDLDSLDNYEEDFMSGSELELGHNTHFLTSDSSKINLLEQNRSSDITDKSQITNRNRSQFLDKNKNGDKFQNKLNGIKTAYNTEDKENDNLHVDLINSRNNSVASSVTSEDLNSNLEDILNSSDSK